MSLSPIPEDILKRKGPRNLALVNPVALDFLHQGRIETANLMEYLAISHTVLIHNVLGGMLSKQTVERLKMDFSTSEVKPASRNAFIGKWLASELGQDGHQMAHTLLQHPSDIVRGWAGFIIGDLPGLTLDERFEQIRPLAADSHYGPREEAWFAVRKHIVTSPLEAVDVLLPWASDPDPNIRRFASEATRPRGVWCAHIQAFRKEPALGLPVLEPLRTDKAKYVQKSVGNWLNDAAKDHPTWVIGLTDKWLAQEPDNKHTAWIVKHARRSL